jgi:hypothetical protein
MFGIDAAHQQLLSMVHLGPDFGIVAAEQQGDRVKTVLVRGKVLYQGKPLIGELMISYDAIDKEAKHAGPARPE